MRKALCAALGCVAFVGVAAGFAAAQQPAAVRPVDAARDKPDFTGVWTNYTAPGQAGGGGRGAGAGAALPFTEEARKKIAAYRALVTPTSETPGGYCLGTGMPGSMLGSGGYPMEIHQRPEQIMIVYEAHSEIRRIYLGDRIPLEEDRHSGPQRHLHRPLGRRHAGGRNDPSQGAGGPATCAQRPGAHRRALSSRAGGEGREGSVCRIDDDRSCVLYRAAESGKALGVGAKRPPAAVRVQRGSLDQAPRRARTEGSHG